MSELIKNLTYFLLYLSVIGLVISLKNISLTKKQILWFNITRVMILVVALVLLFTTIVPAFIH